MNPQTLLSDAKLAWSRFWKNRTKRSRILDDLIRGVEQSSGDARTDARAKAKSWLISHVATLSQRDIQMARLNFDYLLPAGWGTEIAEGTAFDFGEVQKQK
jgi:hypothetical protein